MYSSSLSIQTTMAEGEEFDILFRGTCPQQSQLIMHSYQLFLCECNDFKRCTTLEDENSVSPKRIYILLI